MKEEAIADEGQMRLMKNVKHLSSNNGKIAMLKEAMHTGSPVVNGDFDIYKINCANGVVDLHTGELLPHDKNYMMSKKHRCGNRYE